jgi:hypothetical protein
MAKFTQPAVRMRFCSSIVLFPDDQLKRLILFLSLFLFTNRTMAQVLVLPPGLHGGNVSIVQLMYGILNNTSAAGINVSVQLTCTTGSQLVANVKSKTFLLPPGITVINAQNAENLLYPVTVNYTDNKLEAFAIRMGALPPNTYQICVTVLKSKNDSVVGKNCYSVTFENYTSVNLLTPMNNSTIKDQYPTHTWGKVTGTSQAFNNDVYYSIKIVEIIDGQSPIEAMKSNPAVFIENGINFNLIQLPITSHPLERGKRYAWQIEAFEGIGINKKNLITSEVWSFRVDYEQQIHWTSNVQQPADTTKPVKKKALPTSKNAYYYSLSTEYPSYVIDVNDTLFFQIENNYSSGSGHVTYTISNLSRNKTASATVIDLVPNQGTNRITLPIQNSIVAKGETGLLTICDYNNYYFLCFKRKEKQ